MTQEIKVGVVVSDEGEFAPIREYAPPGAEKTTEVWNGYPSVVLVKRAGDQRLVMRVVLCGVGLSSAAAATAYLIADGACYICNEGLSGALKGLARGELVVGSEFVQHDFDATGIGYQKGQISGMDPVLPVFGDLTSRFLAMHSQLKSGRLASGDAFICSEEKKRELAERIRRSGLRYGILGCGVDLPAGQGSLSCSAPGRRRRGRQCGRKCIVRSTLRSTRGSLPCCLKACPPCFCKNKLIPKNPGSGATALIKPDRAA